MKVYPCGYNAHGTEIEQLMCAHRDLVMVDTRLKPWSYKPAWRKASLHATYGARYCWAGEYLGNLNYKNGGPIRLANPQEGLQALACRLQAGSDLVLLCACAEYNECHRRVIVELLQAELPALEVVMPVKPEPMAEKVNWLYEQRGGYGFIIPCPAIAVKKNPQTVRIAVWSYPRRRIVFRNVSPDKLEERTGEQEVDVQYVEWVRQQEQERQSVCAAVECEVQG